MDMFERVAYSLFALIAILWTVGLLIGMVAAFPFGLIALGGFIAVGLLLIKVLKERLANKEVDHSP